MGFASSWSASSPEAPVTDFPVQPSQKDGLGRMCKPHWREYTNALRKAAVARKTDATTEAPKPETEVVENPDEAPEPEGPAPRTARRSRTTVEPADGVEAA